MLSDGLHDVPPGKLAMVVTYLEMRAPVALRPGPAPRGATLERIPTPGLDWYRTLFTRVGGQDWLWYSRLQMPDDALAAILHDPRLEVHALMHNGRAEGLLELDFRLTGECELSFLGVTGALIGTGAGRYLMNQAITRAWDSPIDCFHVHTCTLDHPDALGFYIRSGFTPVRQYVEIDDDPRIHGSLPRDAGPHVPIFDRGRSPA